MNKVYLDDNRYVCEVPLTLREELTNKGIIPKEIDPDDTELVIVVAFGTTTWYVVWYDGQTKHTYLPCNGCYC